MKNNQFNYRNTLLIVVLVLSVTGCRDFVEIDPPKTEIVTSTVFNNDASAISAVRGIYSTMMTGTGFTNSAMEINTGIASDELINYATRIDKQQFAQNSLAANNNEVLSLFWKDAYTFINNANAILEGLELSTAVSPNIKQQLVGEAKFIRAFCHFYLVNLYGDIPIITLTDYRINAIAPRNSVESVNIQIENDLLDAIDYLADDYSFSNGQKTQPNKDVAKALLARYYLYQEDWTKAENYASELIDQVEKFSLSNLNEVFLKNSSEAIWQLMPVIPNTNTIHAQRFILTAPPNSFSKTVSITPELVNAFEDPDNRKINWTGTFTNESGTWHYPFKYKELSGELIEYVMVFRLAEQYLIRAEARAHQDKLILASEDLNVIRNRAGLANTAATDQPSLLLAIAQERKVELFAEWGHRWMDLKRTQKADEVLGPIKPDWQPTDILFPIPDSERLLNSNLTQNPGY